MSDFDKNMKDALDGDGGFDPDRASSTQAGVYREYQKKMKQYERIMWLMVYLLCAVGAYAAGGFAVQATTTKEWIGYGLVFLFCMIVIIQKTILFGVGASQLVTMKEIKQLRLALAGEAVPQTDAVAKPLRGIVRWERAAWLVGLLAISQFAVQVGMWTNRQADLWRLGAGGRIEAHNVLTLRRFPHEIPSFYGVKGPVEGAVLESVSLNGQPVPIDRFKARQTNVIQLPHRLSWKKDKVELVWSFQLPAMKHYAAFRAPLRSLMPVHGYALVLYVEDDSGYVVQGDAWKFNKSTDELKNKAEALRTLKCFTWGPWSGTPRDNFGSCGLSIGPRPAGPSTAPPQAPAGG